MHVGSPHPGSSVRDGIFGAAMFVSSTCTKPVDNVAPDPVGPAPGCTCIDEGADSSKVIEVCISAGDA